MVVIYAIVGGIEDVKLHRITLGHEYSFVELSLPSEGAGDMKPADAERHARWLEFSGEEVFSRAPERNVYYVHLFSDSTANKLAQPTQHAVTLQCLMAVAKHREYAVADQAFNEQMHSWDTDVRIMAQYLWNAYCRQTDSAAFLKALASFSADEIRPFLTDSYNELVELRQKHLALDGARNLWRLSVKDVTGIVCGGVL